MGMDLAVVALMRERLDAYHGDRVRKDDVREWLDVIEGKGAATHDAGDPYKRWTITIDPGRPSEEAITIYASNSYESDVFMGRLIELANGRKPVGAYAETTTVADPRGPRGESGPIGEVDAAVERGDL